MNKYKKSLLVIIAEADLERLLVQDIERLGASGYTITDVRGGGPGGKREGAWQADRTVRIEVICDEDLADEIGGHVLQTYGQNYGVTIYFSQVQVLRPQKF